MMLQYNILVRSEICLGQGALQELLSHQAAELGDRRCLSWQPGSLAQLPWRKIAQAPGEPQGAAGEMEQSRADLGRAAPVLGLLQGPLPHRACPSPRLESASVTPGTHRWYAARWKLVRHWAEGKLTPSAASPHTQQHTFFRRGNLCLRPNK